MLRPLLFLFASTAFCTAFLPSSSRHAAFVRQEHQRISSSPSLHMKNTDANTAAQHDDWDLPEPSRRRTGADLDDSPLSRLQEEEEKASNNKYVNGDDLHMLREQVMSLRNELQQARGRNAPRRIQQLERAILKVQQVDAEFVYAVALERMEAAQENDDPVQAKVFQRQAMEARAALPHFQMEGLWVGKYDDSSYEMINVTYVGDTLIAYKVTGHSNVPRGEVSFQVDLSPRAVAVEALEPIALDESAADQWGAKFLQRYAGEGQVAAQGFVNNQFVEGQLILVNEYFSFAWVPIGHQVFFGRPSPDLVLQMLRDADEPQSPEEKIRVHLERCMEETEILEEEEEIGDGNFYSHDQQDYYSHDGFFE